MSKNDGGPAFPCGWDTRDAYNLSRPTGMTLRDCFAAKIMQGRQAAGYNGPGDCNSLEAEMAYRLADAMLAEREKGETR